MTEEKKELLTDIYTSSDHILSSLLKLKKKLAKAVMMLLLERLDTNNCYKPEEESVYNVIQAKYAEMTSFFMPEFVCSVYR